MSFQSRIWAICTEMKTLNLQPFSFSKGYWWSHRCFADGLQVNTIRVGFLGMLLGHHELCLWLKQHAMSWGFSWNNWRRLWSPSTLHHFRKLIRHSLQWWLSRDVWLFGYSLLADNFQVNSWRPWSSLVRTGQDRYWQLKVFTFLEQDYGGGGGGSDTSCWYHKVHLLVFCILR